jgi:hypothetical protein
MAAGKAAALEKMLVRLEWGIPIEGSVQIRPPMLPEGKPAGYIGAWGKGPKWPAFGAKEDDDPTGSA